MCSKNEFYTFVPSHFDRWHFLPQTCPVTRVKGHVSSKQTDWVQRGPNNCSGSVCLYESSYRRLSTGSWWNTWCRTVCSTVTTAATTCRWLRSCSLCCSVSTSLCSQSLNSVSYTTSSSSSQHHGYITPGSSSYTASSSGCASSPSTSSSLSSSRPRFSRLSHSLKYPTVSQHIGLTLSLQHKMFSKERFLWAMITSNYTVQVYHWLRPLQLSLDITDLVLLYGP